MTALCICLLFFTVVLRNDHPVAHRLHPGLDPGRTDLLGIVFHQQGAGGKIDRGMRNPGQ